MLIIFNIIWIACVSVLFVVAEPMIMAKRGLGFKEELIGRGNPLRDKITKLLYCALCSGFWIGLAFTQDVRYAAIISILSEMIHKKINH